MDCQSGDANQSAGCKTPALALALVFIFLLSPVCAQTSVTLAWNAVNSPGVTGYKLYYGVASHSYTNALTVTNGTQITVTGLKTGTTYFFSVTMLNSSLGESLFSSEIRYPDLPAITITAPTNGATYDSSASLTVSASVTPNGHTINLVRFFNGSTLLATHLTSPYSYTVSKALSNSYSFHATLTYDGTNSIDSPVVNVSAAASGLPPATLPALQIAAPGRPASLSIAPARSAIPTTSLLPTTLKAGLPSPTSSLAAAAVSRSLILPPQLTLLVFIASTKRLTPFQAPSRHCGWGASAAKFC